MPCRARTAGDQSSRIDSQATGWCVRTRSPGMASMPITRPVNELVTGCFSPVWTTTPISYGWQQDQIAKNAQR